MELTSIVAIAGSVTLGVFGKFAYDGIRRRNGNGVSSLEAHDDSATSHQDIREDITKIDGKLEGIGDTSNKILAHLESRQDGNNA